jgi:uncharacterized protein (TIGR03086 family)
MTNPTTTNRPTDPRPALLRAGELTATLVDAVGAEDLDRPTPCADWAVRDLLAHLVAVTHRVAHIARGGAPFDLPSLVDGVPEQGWSAGFRAGLRDVAAAWADDDLLGRVVQHPIGAVPGAVAATIYTQEFTAHAGDLAVALGRTDLLDEELAEQVLLGSQRTMPVERPAGYPFGPVVEVPADAPAHVRLAAWLGRDLVAV